MTDPERLAAIEGRLTAAAEERARTAKDILDIESALVEVKADAKEVRRDVQEIKVAAASVATNQAWEMKALERIEGKVDGLGHHSEISGHQHIIHNGQFQKVAVMGGGGLTGVGAIMYGVGRALGWW